MDACAFSGSAMRMLGKTSLPLFLSNSFYASHWKGIMPAGSRDWLMVVCYLAAAAATTAAVMCGAAFIRRHTLLFQRNAAGARN